MAGDAPATTESVGSLGASTAPVMEIAEITVTRDTESAAATMGAVTTD